MRNVELKIIVLLMSLLVIFRSGAFAELREATITL